MRRGRLAFTLRAGPLRHGNGESVTAKAAGQMARSILTHLMFVGDHYGRAEEAINLYVSLFEDSRVIEVERYGPDEGEREGTVKRAAFSLAGREFRASDSGRPHPFTFTPAMSIFVDCESPADLERVFAALSDGSEVLMPLDDYGFSQRFGWTNDHFGVSWQLNLP
jgi:predicted 3-demethylubiquinone-9 3-methyltransferase (glyoxalase superfamily)